MNTEQRAALMTYVMGAIAEYSRQAFGESDELMLVEPDEEELIRFSITADIIDRLIADRAATDAEPDADATVGMVTDEMLSRAVETYDRASDVGFPNHINPHRWAMKEALIAAMPSGKDDAETVVVRDLSSVLRLEYARGYGDAKREQQFNVVSSTTYQPIATMPSGRDANTSTPPLHMAAVMSGGDPNWLDAALDSVGADDIIVQRVRHPRNDIDWEHPGYTFCCDLWSHANYDDPNPDPISGGTGTTRREAILDAVQKAKEARING